jgi:hypothetical protein
MGRDDENGGKERKIGIGALRRRQRRNRRSEW